VYYFNPISMKYNHKKHTRSPDGQSNKAQKGLT
jgi:hypothetical protein